MSVSRQDETGLFLQNPSSTGMIKPLKDQSGG